MRVKLLAPQNRNWLLMADGLNDPQGWNRFVPCLSEESDRFVFDGAVKELATSVKLSSCKDMLVEGISAFEYSWESDEDAVLDHAMQVADRLKIELLLGDENPTNPTKTPSAA